MTTPLRPRTPATERLREALNAERATSGGNPMTVAAVVGWLSGPWLDYIAEPYIEAEAAPDLRAALERLDAPLQWLHEHYPKAFVEMPTALFRRFKEAERALAAPAADGLNRVTVVMPEGSTFTPGPGLTPLAEPSREPGEEG